MILTPEQEAKLEKQRPPVRYSEFGKMIHDARKARKITQFQLADMVGIDFTKVSYIESGRTLPTKEQLMKIAAITGFDPAIFAIRNFILEGIKNDEH